VLFRSFLVERRPVALGETVEVAPGQGDVEIHYTGLSFIKSEHVKFKYQLVGLDRDWVDAGTRRAVYYSHLPPGDYTFRVIAANADGVWNTEGARVRIRVLPPFYRTWWFVTAAALFVAAAAFLLYRRRVSQLKRARAAQEEFSRRLIESQEQERKRIAAELHDGLGQDLLIIKNRAVLGRMQVGADGGAAGEQLDEISESASQAIDEVREIAYNLRPHHLDRLGLTKTLVAMVDKASAASDTRFACRVADLDGALPKSSEINFYRVVQECINNILRHSRASEAWVEIDRDERALEVRIGDNGRGFAPEAAAASRGFGLTGIGERVRMLGGSFAIHTAPGGGTRVAIKLPLPKDGGST
jgi:signal transduction histidine kinase